MRFLALLSMLVLTASLGSVPVSAAETGRQTVITRDSDYFGFDLRTEQNVSLDRCKQICEGDGNCRAFTYNPKVKWCFLKSDYNTLNSFPGAVAGRIVEATNAPDIGAPPRLAFVTDQQVKDARDMKQQLTVDEAQAKSGVGGLVDYARMEAEAGRVENALYSFKAAAAIMPDDAEIWLGLAHAAAGAASGNPEMAAQTISAAINAYQVTRTAQLRADALAVLAAGLDAAQIYRPALTAYKASLDLADAATVRAAYADLRARQGFRVTENRVDSDTASPRACVQFSEQLMKAGTDYASFVTLDGQPARAVEAKGSEICVDGLVHGRTYKLSLRKGLPSTVGENLEAPVDLTVYVRDRAAAVRFTGDGFVLPSSVRRGIPLVSVNMAAASLKLYRIGDRGIAPLMTGSQFLTQMDGYGSSRIADEQGELVWEGKIDIATELNKDVVTSFPVDEALPERKPGVYVLTAEPENTPAEDWNAKATQWFVVSDIGLSTYAGTDGLTVFVRSLASATPLAGIELQLLAKNNEVLGSAVTDDKGIARFTAGLMRGTAAMVPAVLTARRGDADYVFLDMTRAGFDLSDRGVTGRTAPGAIDVLAWTERGIYRPGETVHAAALARDIEAKAVEKLPLTFIFRRPDGVEDRRLVSQGGKLGGHTLDLALQDNAMRGTWMMQVYTDPKGTALAEKQFLVDDFVPDRIEFDMTSSAKDIDLATPVTVDVNGRFLYGAPAAGLTLEGEVRLKPVRDNPAFVGYLFGLADEEAEEETQFPLEGLEPLDSEGKTAFEVALSDLPATTKMLNAEVTLRLREAGGRAVERKLTLPVKPEGPMIGIRPEFEGDLAENSIGKFHVISVEPDGSRVAKSGLAWTLVSVQRNYQWYRDGSSWRYEPVLSTTRVADGRIDVTADGAEIAVPVGWGRYRLEVASAEADGPVSSVEFDAGWYVEAQTTETPDGLEIATDKDAYAIGDTVKLKVSPRFAGQVMVTAGSETVISTVDAAIPAGGGEIDIPVTADWGAGTYLTATLFRPGDDQDSHMPMRAIGIKWVGVDPGKRKLAVSLDLPEKTLPRQPLQIPVSVTGAEAGEEAYVILAAVDVGILNLTRYEAPDPERWYFGQRRLGLEIRDLYGRLIDGSLGATGRLRTGGDGGQVPLQGSPPTEKLVAFFAGPVRLGEDGKAVVSFDIPQFNGTARVMAVAWTKTGLGHAVGDVVIRDPIVVTASLPKFMAPGDTSQLRLDIANTDAPAGDYQLAVAAGPQVSVEEASRTVTLDEGGRTSLTLALSAVQPGDASVELTLSNTSGISLSQTLTLPVRPATLPMTTRRPIALAPGKSLTVNGDLLAGSILPGASVSLNLTRSPAFDIAALLMSLDKYPYGCAEQTTSRALPLLYFSELAKASGLGDDADIRKRVQDAIYRVLSYQSSSGSFGLWGPGYGDLWLDAYVTDFLTRARELKYDVPEQAMVIALQNLQNGLGLDTNVKDRGNEMAYSLYVLARNRKAAISDLRYYADTALADFPTPLARAHLASALSLYGDAPRSRDIFANAVAQASATSAVSLSRSDYGSALRDASAVLALAAESRPVPPVIPDLATVVAREFSTSSSTSTQEQSWMLLAARAIAEGDRDLLIDIDGREHQGGYSERMTGDALLASPVTVTNRSSEELTAVVTTIAAPVDPLPAGGEGYAIERSYYTLDGAEANVSEASQNERYVVVLKATPLNDWSQRILVTDLLPAGFEIDNPGLVSSAQLSSFDWLEEVQAAHTEFRSDRFVAAFDRAAGESGEITLAYVVRAVTPGLYDHPAASVEDMYRPQFSARTATGRMEVQAAAP